MKVSSLISYFALFLISQFIFKNIAFCQRNQFNKTTVAQKEFVLNQILQKLYNTSGYRNFKIPEVKIVQSDYLAATYNYTNNIIKFEDKLYQLCRSCGKDSIDAMAFILAHELYHANEKAENIVDVDLSFIEHSMTGSLKIVSEQNADIWGSFLCYLSGFNPTEIFETLFDKIYVTYKVSETSSSKYPSLEERKLCIQNMYQRVEELIQIFELGLVLNIESEFELAENCYKHILQFYKSPEIYNNIGISIAYQAMSNYGISIDQYYYPFELDVNSKLYNIKKSRGERSSEDIFLRHKILEQALKHFYRALQLNPDYLPAYTNIISSLNLMEKPQEAIRLFDSLRIQKLWNQKSSNDFEKLSIAIGISYALSGKDECKEYFSSCLNSQDLRTKHFSRSNLKVYSNNIVATIPSDCPIQDEYQYTKPSLPLGRHQAQRVYLGQNSNIQVQFYNSPEVKQLRLSNNTSTELTITRAKPSSKLKNNLQKVMNKYQDHSELSFIPGKEVNFLKCRSEEILYKLSKTGRVLERIKIQKI